jgi:predicted lysophospholipase L1 biosynthesis ABC-type transport system permease subunit
MSPERALRWLLRLPTFELRADHGREMEQVFQEQHREARAHGRAEVMGVWWRAAADIAHTAPREHAAQLAQDAGFALRMMEVVGASLAARRRDTWLIGAFAALALAVAAVGVYGVTAYHVAQRRREIGLRVALGAERGDVVRMVLAQGMRLVGAGMGVGLPAALAATAALRSLLFDVTPYDVSVLAAMAVLLVAVAALACAVPALRAARVDAAVALRDE